MKILIPSAVVLMMVWIIAYPFGETNIPEVEDKLEQESLTYGDIVEVVKATDLDKTEQNQHRSATKIDVKMTVLTSKILVGSLSVPESTYDETSSYINPPILIGVEPPVQETVPAVPAETAQEAIQEQVVDATVTVTEPATQAVQETQAQEVYNGTPLYGISEPNGVNVLDESIQTFLYNELSSHGIGWFFPYAIMIAYQESRFITNNVSKDGLDHGLFQYRLQYYPGSDIYNPYEQIGIFVQQMSNRASAGCSVLEMISRHMMSDYGSYNQDYVNQVMQHECKLVRLR